LSPENVVKGKSTIYILTFHGLGNPERDLPEGEGNFWLDKSFFEAILDRVKERPDVRITFDDSNSSDFRIALPALSRRRLRAAFFVVSERIDQPGFLTSEEVRTLANSGMAIGSHGKRHRRWAWLNPGELYEELNESRAKLESLLGQKVREAACPFGSYNRAVFRGLRAAGYEGVYTSDGGPSRVGEWVSARNTIVRSHTLRDVQRIIDSKQSGLVSMIRMSKFALKQGLAVRQR
jgi:peptidoglycan/xylan/chitin deacetylase (PgdA/CDA1 family)